MSGSRSKKDRSEEPLVVKHPVTGDRTFSMGDRSYPSGLQVYEKIMRDGMEGMVQLPPQALGPNAVLMQAIVYSDEADMISHMAMLGFEPATIDAEDAAVDHGAAAEAYVRHANEGAGVDLKDRRSLDPDDPDHAHYLSGNGPGAGLIREAMRQQSLQKKEKSA